MAENLHLTLVFLGECDREKTVAAKSVVAATSFSPFLLEIDRVGRFSRERGDIWWAGVRECEALVTLREDLAGRLISAGFQVERRKYAPHVTLGREIASDARPWEVEAFGEKVSQIELMKSERTGGALTYTAIAKSGARVSRELLR